ncbi:tetratricopeptide repeat protein [Paraburkholderia jirisanensis]
MSMNMSGRAAERRDALLRACALDPHLDAALRLQLVLVFREARDWRTVAQIARAALARDPADAEMAWQLSHAQWQCGDAQAAELTMGAVGARARSNGAVLAAIGTYRAEQARYRDAEAALREALTVEPDLVQASVDLAELELRRGIWTGAWLRYEARLARTDREPNNVVHLFAQSYPRWCGEPVDGKTLVVYSEQGCGDDIQMVRFVPTFAARVRQQGGSLVLACRHALQPLFARFCAPCSVPCVAIEEGVPDAHYALPMMSLPYEIGLLPEQVTGSQYLRADNGLIAAWREHVQAFERANPQARGERHRALRVGLVWSGSATHRRDAKRSVRLDALAPLADLQGVVFHPLTPGKEADTAALAAQGLAVCDLTAQYRNGFDDVAAHMSALDVLVTIDSAPLHLGGALGRPVLALLDHVSHWCWGIGESQNWYDSVELFRQPAPGEWGPVVARVTGRLAEIAQAVVADETVLTQSG